MNEGLYGFGTTWGWVINDNFHFGVNYAFKWHNMQLADF